MFTLFLIFLSILPVLILLIIFERQDKGKKEPFKLKWRVFKWGMLATILAGVIEIFLDGGVIAYIKNPIFYSFITAFLTAGLVEEGLKFWVVKKFVYMEKHFDEIMDGITYAIIASLGFAMLENVLYVLEGGIQIALLRGFLSVPAHVAFSGIMGFYIGKAKMAKSKKQETNYLIIGLAWGICYHGAFNFLLFVGDYMLIFIIPLMFTMFLHLRNLIKRAHFEDKVILNEPVKLSLLKILRVFLSAILIIIGTGSFAMTLWMFLKPGSIFVWTDLIYSGVLLVFAWAIALLLCSKICVYKKT